MNAVARPRRVDPLCLLLALVCLEGCQPASRYTPVLPDTRSSTSQLPQIPKRDPGREAAAAIIWQEPDPQLQAPEVPIVFVPPSSSEWHGLKEYWNLDWHRPLAGLGGTPPLGAWAMLGGGWLTPSVRIKVPLGLDDPTPHIPAVNPPTLARWQLGKDLFFDDRVLEDDPELARLSCATCHNPETGFTDNKVAGRYSHRDTPTLINVVFNRRQFWDGRVELLEEVVQQGEEAENASTPRFHSWPGVVRRLRNNREYVARFQEAFGTLPTQDAVGKALATYMRTILCGDAIQDRAEQARRQRGADTLTAADYERVLDAAALKTLPWRHGPNPSRGELAEQLLRGHNLFHGRAGCVNCHGGAIYSDGEFHNLGVGESSMPRVAGFEQGRFAVAPPGEKSLYLIGAFKTPTLRGLPASAPYFHNGSRLLIDRDLDEVLFEVTAWHLDRAPRLRSTMPYLAPQLHHRSLKEEELASLVVFLKALAGQPPPAVVTQR